MDVTQYVRVNIGYNPVTIQAHRDAVRIVFSTTQPTLSNTAFHILDGSTPPFNIPFTTADLNIWALATSINSSLTVTEYQHHILNRDFNTEVALGNVPGYAPGFMIGRNTDIGIDNFELLWDVGGDYTFLTSETTLYLSSTSPLDTAVTVIMSGLDGDYVATVGSAVTNGQNQVALSTDYLRHGDAVVIGGDPQGDLYIAEADTLTGGIPDTPSKIKAKLPLTGFDAGTEFAHSKSSHNGILTVPAGKTIIILTVLLGAKKNDDIELQAWVRLSPTSPWLNRQGAEIYQSIAEFATPLRSPLPEKADLLYRVKAGSEASSASIQLQYWTVDN